MTTRNTAFTSPVCDKKRLKPRFLNRLSSIETCKENHDKKIAECPFAFILFTVLELHISRFSTPKHAFERISNFEKSVFLLNCLESILVESLCLSFILGLVKRVVLESFVSSTLSQSLACHLLPVDIV